MKFDRFIAILEANGFVLARQGKGSHSVWSGTISGKVRAMVAWLRLIYGH